MLAGIKDKEIASRTNGENSEISNDAITGLLKKMIKQRNDSIEMFLKANRKELVNKEKAEISIINEFLPKQMNESDTFDICIDAILKSEAKNLRDIGKVIKYIKEKNGDTVDMSIASKVLKEKLK